MTVAELIEDLQAMPPDAIAVNSDGDEIDSVEEGDDNEVVLFTEADEDDPEPAVIDVESRPI